MFLTIFLMSLFISTLIFSVLNVRTFLNETTKNIKLATKIRQELGQQRLDTFSGKIEKLITLGALEDIYEEPVVKNIYHHKEVKPFKYSLKDGNIDINIGQYTVEIDKSYLYHTVAIRGGIIEKYKPIFEIGDIDESGKICSREKFKNSNFYLTGCIEKQTVIELALYQSLRESSIFLLTLIVVFISVYSLIKRVLLFPLKFLIMKLNEIELKGVRKVKFNLHKFGEDELAFISKTLEDFRMDIVKSQDKMRLIFETVNKMISMTNNIHGFGLYVLNQLDYIIDLNGSILVITSSTSETDDVIQSNRVIKSGIKIPNEVIEVAKSSNQNTVEFSGKRYVVIKKSIEKDISVMFIGLLNRELSDEDMNYLEIIMSDFVYIVNINNLATQDYLTKLPNRRKLLSEMRTMIEMSKRYQKPLSILLIDIDDFKAINDTYGHDAGDMILINISNLIKGHLREIDIFGRYGGEEFLIILPNSDNISAIQAGERIRKVIESNGFQIDGNLIKLTVSIGVASLYKHGQETDDLIKAADISLYRAKRDGKNRVVSLPPEEINKVIKMEFEAKNTIRKAIDEDRLIPFYQPIIDINTSEIVGYEVLARIFEEKENRYTPAYLFINDALKYGLGSVIDKVIQQKAIKYLSFRRIDKLIFFNLSRAFLSEPEVLDRVYNLITENGLKPANVVFEITEEEAITDIVKVRELIRYGKYLGFKFAIDDFGAGYSNFIYLKHFNVDIVKIDGSLISNIDKDPDDKVIVESIVKIAKYKGIKTLAEMVETQQEFDVLKSIGIDYVQGFFISKPLREV